MEALISLSIAQRDRWEALWLQSVPSQRPLVVTCKTRRMKCPVRERQPGHRRTPA